MRSKPGRQEATQPRSESGVCSSYALGHSRAHPMQQLGTSINVKRRSGFPGTRGSFTGSSRASTLAAVLVGDLSYRNDSSTCQRERAYADASDPSDRAGDQNWETAPGQCARSQAWVPVCMSATSSSPRTSSDPRSLLRGRTRGRRGQARDRSRHRPSKGLRLRGNGKQPGRRRRDPRPGRSRLRRPCPHGQRGEGANQRRLRRWRRRPQPLLSFRQIRIELDKGASREVPYSSGRRDSS